MQAEQPIHGGQAEQPIHGGQAEQPIHGGQAEIDWHTAILRATDRSLLGDHASAEVALQEARKLALKHGNEDWVADADIMSIQFLFEQQQFEEAERKAVELATQFEANDRLRHRVHLDLLRAQYSEYAFDYDRCEAHLRAAVATADRLESEFAPNQVRANVALMEFLLKKADFAGALKPIEVVFRERPAMVMPHGWHRQNKYLAAKVYLANEQLAEARAAFEQAEEPQAEQAEEQTGEVLLDPSQFDFVSKKLNGGLLLKESKSTEALGILSELAGTAEEDLPGPFEAAQLFLWLGQAQAQTGADSETVKGSLMTSYNHLKTGHPVFKWFEAELFVELAKILSPDEMPETAFPDNLAPGEQPPGASGEQPEQPPVQPVAPD
jgi:tetratricopeptide (TPR) repeat protein